ncbi:hypothetical protein EYF80_029278 [Liparis tanakae]|uniref:Uncharacterized protein n=1 Tax=Liparis tanakae TaxID=230148 RepID=A0A4Z2H3J4_9TELE|nr:hypothetical protein EYF80_029278 [Liparis tanakae]
MKEDRRRRRRRQKKKRGERRGTRNKRGGPVSQSGDSSTEGHLHPRMHRLVTAAPEKNKVHHKQTEESLPGWSSNQQNGFRGIG